MVNSILRKGAQLVSELEFVSEGSVLRGRLFTPDIEGPTPGIVMAPGFSATSHFAVFERYARAIAAIGVAVFLFDYRGFSPSEGEPRHDENTNGLLRQYFPKGTDMSRLTQTDLDKAAHSLNGRPRQTLDGMPPSEKLAEVLQ